MSAGGHHQEGEDQLRALAARSRCSLSLSCTSVLLLWGVRPRKLMVADVTAIGHKSNVQQWCIQQRVDHNSGTHDAVSSIEFAHKSSQVCASINTQSTTHHKPKSLLKNHTIAAPIAPMLLVTAKKTTHQMTVLLAERAIVVRFPPYIRLQSRVESDKCVNVREIRRRSSIAAAIIVYTTATVSNK